jgi:hypothetical protein
MRRTFGFPVGIALLAGSLTWLIQSVLRPAMGAHPAALWLFGPAPNMVVGLAFPLLALGYPFESFASTRRGVVITTALTIGILLMFELWTPFLGARTFDPLDILGSVVGGVVGGLCALAFARRRYAVHRAPA